MPNGSRNGSNNGRGTGRKEGGWPSTTDKPSGGNRTNAPAGGVDGGNDGSTGPGPGGGAGVGGGGPTR